MPAYMCDMNSFLLNVVNKKVSISRSQKPQSTEKQKEASEEQAAGRPAKANEIEEN